jgi:hypothetical protein
MADGSLLRWNAATGKWLPMSLPANTGSLTKIAQVVTAGNQQYVTFTDIPQTYDDLVLVIVGQTVSTTPVDNVILKLDGDYSASYMYETIRAYGATTYAQTSVLQTGVNLGDFAGGQSIGAGYIEVTIPAYSNTTLKKAGTSKFGLSYDTSDPRVGEVGFFWNNTSAIASILLDTIMGPAGWANGSVVTLYGRGGATSATFSGGSAALDKDRFAPPYASDFPTLLATNSTNPNIYWSGTTGLVVGSGINFTGSDQVRGIVKPLPSGNWTVTARFRSNHRGLGYETVGLILRDSTSGKLIQFGHDTTILDIVRWNSQTSYNSIPWQSQNYTPGNPEWFRIAYDGTNLNYSISVDGTYWTLLYSESITAFTPSLNQVGFGLHIAHSSGAWNTATTGDDVLMHVFYYNDDSLPASSRVIGGVPLSIPSITQFQPVSSTTALFGANSGSAAITQSPNGVVITMPGTSNLITVRTDIATYPTPPVSFVFGMKFADVGTAAGSTVVMLDGSAGSNKMILLAWVNGTIYVEHQTYTSTSTALVSTPFQGSMSGSPGYFGIYDDGTNLNFQVGNDPYALSTIYSESRTAYLTTPGKVGVFLQGSGAGTTNVFSINYLKP